MSKVKKTYCTCNNFVSTDKKIEIFLHLVFVDQRLYTLIHSDGFKRNSKESSSIPLPVGGSEISISDCKKIFLTFHPGGNC